MVRTIIFFLAGAVIAVPVRVISLPLPSSASDIEHAMFNELFPENDPVAPRPTFVETEYSHQLPANLLPPNYHHRTQHPTSTSTSSTTQHDSERSPHDQSHTSDDAGVVAGPAQDSSQPHSTLQHYRPHTNYVRPHSTRQYYRPHTNYVGPTPNPHSTQGYYRPRGLGISSYVAGSAPNPFSNSQHPSNSGSRVPAIQPPFSFGDDAGVVLGSIPNPVFGHPHSISQHPSNSGSQGPAMHFGDPQNSNLQFHPNIFIPPEHHATTAPTTGKRPSDLPPGPSTSKRARVDSPGTQLDHLHGQTPRREGGTSGAGEMQQPRKRRSKSESDSIFHSNPPINQPPNPEHSESVTESGQSKGKGKEKETSNPTPSSPASRPGFENSPAKGNQPSHSNPNPPDYSHASGSGSAHPPPQRRQTLNQPPSAPKGHKS